LEISENLIGISENLAKKIGPMAYSTVSKNVSDEAFRSAVCLETPVILETRAL